MFLKHSGIKPSQKFLDLGCGTLSLGNYLIEYLDSGNYVGMDISAQALIKGKELVERRIGREKLEEKQPTLIQNEDLTFSEVGGQVFDYVWAFSVFDHLPFKYFEEFISNIGNVTDHDSRIFLIVMLKEKNSVAGGIPYLYSFSFYNPRCEYDYNCLRKLLVLNDYKMEMIDTRKHWGNLLRNLVLLELSRR
ncbi:class I SAM-dependent methyltransferase [Candidatus Bathyarchaeota archaeon]|nr:class I SAM-dependent methyltransferase [Candidatus Bathyarchaeota archaeon]